MAVVQTNINSCYGGTINNVAGEQVNNIHYHFPRTGGLPLLASNWNDHSSSSATIDQIRSLLKSFAPYSSLTFDPVLEEMESIRALILCVTPFISLLDRVPLLRDFEFFKRTQEVLDQCNTHFNNLHEDLLAYETNIQSRLAGCGFFRAQFLLIHAHARWGPKLARIKQLIGKNRQPLEQCYWLFASDCKLKTEFWTKLGHADVESAKQRLLENEVFVSSIGRIRYLPPAQVFLNDHLDRTLCIPMELCASWKEFNTLVQRWCQDAPGANHIQRNSWELYNTQSNLVITRTETGGVNVQANTKLAISIILKLNASKRGVCPQCSFDNSFQRSDTGRMTCIKCEASFSVSFTGRRSHTEHLESLPSTTASTNQSYSRILLTLRQGFGIFRRKWNQKTFPPFKAPDTKSPSAETGPEQEQTAKYRRVTIKASRDLSREPNTLASTRAQNADSTQLPPERPCIDSDSAGRQRQSRFAGLMTRLNIHIPQLQPDLDIVLLLGLAAAGKSTFGNMASEREAFEVARGLGCGTTRVQTHRVTNPQVPHTRHRRGRHVLLVDSPPLDGMMPFDEIKYMIRKSLKRFGQTAVSGILYFHRMTDSRRMDLPPRKFLCDLLGRPNPAAHTVVTTTMSSHIEASLRTRRLEELHEIWEPLLIEGSSIKRFEDSHESAWEIINTLLDRASQCEFNTSKA